MATAFVGLSVITAVLTIIFLVFLFFLKSTTVFHICGWMQILSGNYKCSALHVYLKFIPFGSRVSGRRLTRSKSAQLEVVWPNLMAIKNSRANLFMARRKPYPKLNLENAFRTRRKTRKKNLCERRLKSGTFYLHQSNWLAHFSFSGDRKKIITIFEGIMQKSTQHILSVRRKYTLQFWIAFGAVDNNNNNTLDAIKYILFERLETGDNAFKPHNKPKASESAVKSGERCLCVSQFRFNNHNNKVREI